MQLIAQWAQWAMPIPMKVLSLSSHLLKDIHRLSKEVSRLYQIKNCTVSDLLREIVRLIHAMRDNLKFAFNSCSSTLEVRITVHPDLYAGLSPLNHISYQTVSLKG